MRKILSLISFREIPSDRIALQEAECRTRLLRKDRDDDGLLVLQQAQTSESCFTDSLRIYDQQIRWLLPEQGD